MPIDRLTEKDLEKATREELISLVFALDSLYFDGINVICLIPPCPLHGNTCVPNAKKWVLEQLSQTLPEGWSK